MKSGIDKLEQILKGISDSYPAFVWTVTTGCEHFKDKNSRICEEMLDFLAKNPDAKSSAILECFHNSIGIPYGDDNGKWYRWGKEITEEDAERIAQEYAEE